MGFLFDLLIELVTTFVPWRTGEPATSRLGESKLDRQSRWLPWLLVAIVLLIAAGVAAWMHFHQ